MEFMNTMYKNLKTLLKGFILISFLLISINCKNIEIISQLGVTDLQTVILTLQIRDPENYSENTSSLISRDYVEKIKFDNKDIPLDILPKNEIKLLIPKIDSKNHIAEIKLKIVKQSFLIPLVTPQNIKEKEIIISSFITLNNDNIKKLEIGYDQDRDGILDKDKNKFISNNGYNFIEIHPDGKSYVWNPNGSEEDFSKPEVSPSIQPKSETQSPPNPRPNPPKTIEDMKPQPPIIDLPTEPKLPKPKPDFPLPPQ